MKTKALRSNEAKDFRSETIEPTKPQEHDGPITMKIQEIPGDKKLIRPFNQRRPAMETLNLADMSLKELLNPAGYDCPCGKHHISTVQDIVIGEHALEHLIPMIRARHMQNPFVICDQNTYDAAGRQVMDLLSAAEIHYSAYTMDSGHPDPSEFWVGAIAMRFSESYDGIIGVGSGVINDICKIIANNTNRPFLIVGTAPSMDGYASDSSSMVLSNLKISLHSNCADGIIGDTSIISQAPMRMLQSGLGDMAAKYTSICEWRISHLINGEYYCEEVASLVRKSLKQCMDSSNLLVSRDPAAVGNIMNGLILSGIAMSYAGVSRPASGTEHYFSHIWDMTALDHGYEHDMHGIQCGIGTLLTLKVYDYIKTITPDREKALRYVSRFSMEDWEADVRKVFGSAAESILEAERKEHKFDKEAHRKRLDHILEHWDEILAIIDEELPPYEELFKQLKATGAPVIPSELNISGDQVRSAFVHTKDIRDKYISSRLLWDLGLLEEAAELLF